MIEDGMHRPCAPHSLYQGWDVRKIARRLRSSVRNTRIRVSALSKVDRGLLASPGTQTLPGIMTGPTSTSRILGSPRGINGYCLIKKGKVHQSISLHANVVNAGVA